MHKATKTSRLDTNLELCSKQS